MKIFMYVLLHKWKIQNWNLHQSFQKARKRHHQVLCAQVTITIIHILHQITFSR